MLAHHSSPMRKFLFLSLPGAAENIDPMTDRVANGNPDRFVDLAGIVFLPVGCDVLVSASDHGAL